MNVIEQFNQLHGKTISRAELNQLRQAAETENVSEITKRIDKLFSIFPDDDSFEIEIANPIKQQVEGLGVAENNHASDDLAWLSACLEYKSEPDELFNGLGAPVTANEIYDYITNMMLNTIKTVGHLPWQKEWKGSGFGGEAKNYVTKKPYTGVNYFMLNFDVKEIDGELCLVPVKFKQPYYLTFNQIEDAGAILKKGSQGRKVFYFTKRFIYKDENLSIATTDLSKFNEFVKENSLTNDDLDKNSFSMPIPKYYNVYRADDCEGLTFPDSNVSKVKVNPIEAAQQIIDEYPNPPKYTFVGDKAYYMPSTDTVNMPTIEAFSTEAYYYSTFFHEIIHSTGHPTRINRKGGKKFGDKEYAFEELVAELGAVFLCGQSGILFSTRENSAKYLKGWNSKLVSCMEDDNRFFMKASAQAQKAANYILDPGAKAEEKPKPKAKPKKQPVSKSNIVGYVLVDSISGETIASKKSLLDLEKVFHDLEENEIGKDLPVFVYEIVSKNGKNVKGKRVLVSWSKKVKPLKAVGQLALFGAYKGVKEINTDFFKNMTVAELRKFTLEYYNTYLKGKKVSIKKHLKEVVFVTTAGRKILKPMYSEKSAVLEHLEELIKRSVYNNWGNRKKTDSPAVLGYLNFKSKITIDGIKRHVRISIVLDENRKTKLKSFEVGKKQESGKLHEVRCRNPKDDGSKPLSDDKDTQNGLNSPSVAPTFNISAEYIEPVQEIQPVYHIVEQEEETVLREETPVNNQFSEPEPTEEAKPVVENKINRPKSPLVKSMADQNHVDNFEYYQIQGDLAEFLGNIEVKPKDSVAITLDGSQGSGKTRLLFQMQNMFASAGYTGLFISLEEHPESALFKEKQDMYIEARNLSKIDTVAELPNGFQDLKNLIPYYDVIYIDSWSKLAEMEKALDFDRDLRKAFDGKLFVVIFQRTVTGGMRGGTKAAFDGDLIMKTDKDVTGDFRNNFAYFDKHRYTSTPLNQLKYNIYSQQLID